MKMGIDDVLNGTKKDVQTFENAEKTAKEAKTGAKFLNSPGRPKKENKAKRRVLYYTDDEFVKIEEAAKIYDMTAAQFIKFVVKKEMKKEGVI